MSTNFEIGDTIWKLELRFPNCSGPVSVPFLARDFIRPRTIDTIRNNRFVIIDFSEQAFLAHVSAWIARGYYASGGRSTTFLASSIDLYALYNNLI